MLEIGESSLLDRVEVDVNDLVEVSCDDLRLFVEIMEVVVHGVVGRILSDEGGKRKRGQVTNCDFVLRAVLNNLSAQV